MKTQKKADELQKLQCTFNWMRIAIHEYVKLVAPLQYAMATAYKDMEKRTKGALPSVELVNVRGAAHEKAFNGLEKTLANDTSLGYPK